MSVTVSLTFSSLLSPTFLGRVLSTSCSTFSSAGEGRSPCPLSLAHFLKTFSSFPSLSLSFLFSPSLYSFSLSLSPSHSPSSIMQFNFSCFRRCSVGCSAWKERKREMRGVSPQAHVTPWRNSREVDSLLVRDAPIPTL